MSILTVSIVTFSVFMQHLPLIKSDPRCIIIFYNNAFNTLFVAESSLFEWKFSDSESNKMYILKSKCLSQIK
jgi:uncharacterized secreted protein with C-terminal beta-propeller domain